MTAVTLSILLVERILVAGLKTVEVMIVVMIL